MFVPEGLCMYMAFQKLKTVAAIQIWDLFAENLSG